MKNIKFLLVLTLGCIALNINAQIQPVDDNGLAIGGYDVVAYFSNTAIQGSTKITEKYNNATYQFSTTENRDTFKSDPEKYLPQFGGHCAWGVGAKDTKFPINPETFDIVDGKLYLFYNGPSEGGDFNAMQLWNVDTTTLKIAAHKKWPSVKKK
ncbi:YHS domain protein [Aquimarina sp. AD10]|uniref:YHS domain-containing (seleno)protein n=1 Tax=Aquimarina sp. AD10 TaxID=1714849 RepID=UPI000E47EC29|nr:YHS domain-containing (seleno)protein [Aquimarina sp. AD10]AXT63728.1 YHS domain protein [Aquimarina sp. AD10]RKM97798.1 YHS domain protein [Aquimarina sp. AD10]